MLNEIDADSIWYQSSLAVFLNRWFSNYADARKSLEDEGGFLLPYKRHFYVCEADVIRAMGMDADDPDWGKIGLDCAKPADDEAHQRLRQKRQKLLRTK